MRYITRIISLFFFSTILIEGISQENKNLNQTQWKSELFSTFSNGNYSPFWINSNNYGRVSTEPSSGYMLIGFKSSHTIKNHLTFNTGISIIATEPRDKIFYLEELFGEFTYKKLRLTIGSFKNYTSLWDESLSTGDMVHSNNARPIPEINISIPRFETVPYSKGWLQIKADFAIGKSFDNNFLEQYIKPNTTYIKSVLWHHKSAYFRISDSVSDFPIELTLGFQHWAQWGGTSSNEKIGKQPQSIGDLIKVIAGSSGGSKATMSDQINVLGNHLGSYDMAIAWKSDKFKLMGYHQLYWEDKSGIELSTGTDGLWGIELSLSKFKWIEKIVLEHFITMNNGGPFHFIDFDHDLWPGRGGGGERYYNNGEYTTGASYFNRGIGNPLLPGPVYNEEGVLGFWNTRVKNWHLGLSGSISNQISYRILCTYMNTYGRPDRPFRNIKRGVSGLIDINYKHPKLKDWDFTGSLAADRKELFGNNLGFSLKIKKTGMLNL